MGYAITIKIFGEIIEDFLVGYFQDIEVAGSITTKKDGKINYIKIDLSQIKKWDQNGEELTKEILTYLSTLFKAKPLDLYYMIEFKNLVVEIICENPENNITKNLTLFYIPNYQLRSESPKPQIKWLIWAKKYWKIILNCIIIALLLYTSILLLGRYPNRQEGFIEAIKNINVFAGIMASFVLGFVMSKTLSLRQEKLARTKTIKDLCTKLTCFRKICYHLRKDNKFWGSSSSYDYANSIAGMITHEEARYPDYYNDTKYAHYKALIITGKHDTSIVMFYLQLYMFGGIEFENNADLAWGSYPPFIIYKNEEIYNYFSFLDFDEFWNCLDYNENETVFSYNHNRFHIDAIEKAASNYGLKGLDKVEFSKDLLLSISSDVQQSVLPELYHLTKLNEAPLPHVIRYLIIMTAFLMFFSIIYPFVGSILSENYLLININGLIILGLIIDVLLRLPTLLNEENTVKNPSDYR